MFGKQCWVPHCNVSDDLQPNRNFFPLPRDPKFKETWLALTGKRLVSEEEVYFCESHFRKSAFKTVMDKVVGLTAQALPFYGMPQMICRTCMNTIPSTALFCVVSGTIPSPVPTELETDLVKSRPEPLYHILTFCIPSLTLEQNPPALVCIKCYEQIWQYFIFKLTCNAIEIRVRGTLSVEEYGKLVLCRACPITSGTRFFILDESQPMGQVFKNVFLKTYPTHVVPLKLCLKCWNVLFKLTQFHQQCVTLDEMRQRCVDVGREQIHNKISVPKTSSLLNLLQTCPSTSSCKDTIPSSYDILSKAQKAVECKVKTMGKKCERKEGLIGIVIDLDPDMPELVPQIKFGPEPKPKIAKRTFTLESKLFLASLILKYSKCLKPHSHPIEASRADLELWVNIVKEFHTAGYTNTLSSLQSLWKTMKQKARLAQKSMGPITYLDYFVNNCVSNISVDSTDCSSTVVSDGLKCHEGLAARQRSVIERTMPVLTVQAPLNETVVTNENCDVICIDDDVEDSKKDIKIDINSGASDTTVKNLWDTDKKVSGNTDQAKITDTLRKFRITKSTKEPTQIYPAPDSPSASNESYRKKRKRKKKQRKSRDVWTYQEKLKLVREMRAMWDSSIETKELDDFRYSPWKVMLEKLAAKGFAGRDFSKLYSEWGMMRRSALIYEKNGLDIVDNEVWDLLQLHKEAQKNTLKRRSGESNESVPQTPVPCKKPKRSIPKKVKSTKPVDILQTSATEGATSATSPMSLSDEELLEVLDLIEREFNEMLSTTGVINKTFTAILKKINYKSYPMDVMMEHWRRVTTAASACKTNPTPVHGKVLELLKTYRQKKVSKKVNVFGEGKDTEQVHNKDKGQDAEQGHGKDTEQEEIRDGNYENKRNLEIISVVRSFDNKVFKKMTKRGRADFWAQVTAKLHASGYKTPTKDIIKLWGKMLDSAKLTWAQEDREPSVGDQEIIDFMTEVIQKKDNPQPESKDEKDDTRQESKSDKEDSNDKGKVVGSPVESEDKVDDVGESSGKDSESENVVFQNYEHVSLEDIQKRYGKDVLDSAKPNVTNEVIEILDSDSDGE